MGIIPLLMHCAMMLSRSLTRPRVFQTILTQLAPVLAISGMVFPSRSVQINMWLIPRRITFSLSLLYKKRSCTKNPGLAETIFIASNSPFFQKKNTIICRNGSDFFENHPKNGWKGFNNGKIVFRAGVSSSTLADSASGVSGFHAP